VNPSTERVYKHRKEAQAKGYKRREYLATPKEHDALKAELERLRGGSR